MELRSRTRLTLRRAVVAAALGALIVPATAGAAAKSPVINKVTPKAASVGTTLTIHGKNFKRGKGKNSVMFRRDKGKALFVKADISTTKRLTVKVPKKLEKYMLVKDGQPVPTRFRVRVLSAKLSRSFTSVSGSPLIGPEQLSTDGTSDGVGVPSAPGGDCDGDKIKNAADTDDDNDLLLDSRELALQLDPCVIDSDFDGVEDGFEYQSALDLNNDDYQEANYVTPFPGKTPYPNPLFKDAENDYDGDGLRLSDEFALWKYTYQVNKTATRSLTNMSYTDGAQYSLSRLEGGNGRRVPTMAVTDYQPPKAFRTWADVAGYGTIMTQDGNPWNLYDMDHSGGAPTTVPTDHQFRAELTYWDLDANSWVSDDERDEDGDGLTNYDEVLGPMSPDWWTGCYSSEGPYVIKYAGTKAYDGDSDGDGILDGADDQDFDDVPNIMELSRNMAGNVDLQAWCDPTGLDTPPGAPAKTWVQPFNPCLPNQQSRSCQQHPAFDAAYPPYQPTWKRLVLN